ERADVDRPPRLAARRRNVHVGERAAAAREVRRLDDVEHARVRRRRDRHLVALRVEPCGRLPRMGEDDAVVEDEATARESARDDTAKRRDTVAVERAPGDGDGPLLLRRADRQRDDLPAQRQTRLVARTYRMGGNDRTQERRRYEDPSHARSYQPAA